MLLACLEGKDPLLWTRTLLMLQLLPGLRLAIASNIVSSLLFVSSSPSSIGRTKLNVLLLLSRRRSL